MIDRISLLDELRDGRFEAAVLTTYSIDFPFFESVVLRRLLACGSEHQVVLVDASQCARALANPERHPRLAGSAYTLVPVSYPGAFHPKLLVLLGKKGGRLLVGSHNLTFSGFGGNAEITNLLRADGAKDREAIATFRTAMNAVRSWAGQQTELVIEVLNAVESIAPWLNVPLGKEDSESLLWSATGRPSLWDQLRSRVGGPVKRVTAIGPFFDGKLAFLHRLQSELTPEKLLVGIDPSSVDLSQVEAQRFGGRFIDVRPLLDAIGVPKSSDLHGKLLRIETERDDLLITGSANPSAPAWLTAESNAEAVIVRQILPAEVAVLGLDSLDEAPDVSSTQWMEIAERRRSKLESQDELAQSSPGQVLIGIACEDRISVHGVDVAPRRVLLHLRSEEVVEAKGWTFAEHTLTISLLENDYLMGCTLLELCETRTVFALVHYPSRLRPHSGGSAPRDLRTALANLPGDPNRLNEIIQLVNRMVFEEDVDASVRGQIARISRSDLAGNVQGGALGPRAIPLSEVKRRGAACRKIADGNIAVVIDLLLRRIGAGLVEESVSIDPPEIEEKDLELLAEASSLHLPAVDSKVLIKACHHKVKKLLERMNDRLKHVRSVGEGASSAVVQLTAVLSVILWMLRSQKELKWLPLGASLLPKDAIKDFFWHASGHLSATSGSVLALARNEAGGEVWEESSVALGLLVWIGWETGTNILELKPHPDEEGRVHYARVGRLLGLLRQITLDERAVTVLKDTLLSFERRRLAAGEWLSTHLEWGELTALADSDPASAPTSAREIRRGDLVRLNMPNGHTAVEFVMDVEGTKIYVASPTQEEGRPVLKKYAVVIDRAMLLS